MRSSACGFSMGNDCTRDDGKGTRQGWKDTSGLPRCSLWKVLQGCWGLCLPETSLLGPLAASLPGTGGVASCKHGGDRFQSSTSLSRAHETHASWRPSRHLLVAASDSLTQRGGIAFIRHPFCCRSWSHTGESEGNSIAESPPQVPACVPDGLVSHHGDTCA